MISFFELCCLRVRRYKEDMLFKERARLRALSLEAEQKLMQEKNEILELYVNKIFLGHRSFGFQAAAAFYYNKPLAELTLAQLAMLAGLPKAPSTISSARSA